MIKKKKKKSLSILLGIHFRINYFVYVADCTEGLLLDHMLVQSNVLNRMVNGVCQEERSSTSVDANG